MFLFFAVMGNPIAHSLSPVIHQRFAEQFGIQLAYDKMLIAKSEFCQAVSHFFEGGGKGLNITAPFKPDAYRLAVEKTQRCAQAQAANTLWMNNNKLHADNTDGVGLIRDLQRHIDLAGRNVLVLGAGGAARGIMAPLIQAKIASLTVFNRTLERAHVLQQDFPEVACVASLSAEYKYDVIINATSAGERISQVLLHGMPASMRAVFCYDLFYSLEKVTPFLQWANVKGAEARDGLGMLVEQAAEAFLIWHGVFPDTLSVLQSLRAKH